MTVNRLMEMDSFVHVASKCSFSAAANELGVSPALITRRLQQLEADLGIPLINRTTRSVSLTEAGKRYYDFCVCILDKIRKEERALKSLHDEPCGQLNIIAPMSFGILEMGKALTAFKTLYPAVNASLIVSDQWRSTFDPSHYGADVLIRFTQPQDSNLFMRKLGRIPWIVCASPAYLNKAGTPQTPAELARHSCLCTLRPFLKGVWPFEGPDGKQTIKVSGVVAPSTAITMRYMALDGTGIALLPIFCVADDLREGRLVRLFEDYKIPEQTISAYYPNARQQPQTMRLFLKFLEERFRNASWGKPLAPA
jgi:DNA-binding transcriptional LysR family regulator